MVRQLPFFWFSILGLAIFWIPRTSANVLEAVSVDSSLVLELLDRNQDCCESTTIGDYRVITSGHLADGGRFQQLRILLIEQLEAHQRFNIDLSETINETQIQALAVLLDPFTVTSKMLEFDWRLWAAFWKRLGGDGRVPYRQGKKIIKNDGDFLTNYELSKAFVDMRALVIEEEGLDDLIKSPQSLRLENWPGSWFSWLQYQWVYQHLHAQLNNMLGHPHVRERLFDSWQRSPEQAIPLALAALAEEVNRLQGEIEAHESEAAKNRLDGLWYQLQDTGAFFWGETLNEKKDRLRFLRGVHRHIYLLGNYYRIFPTEFALAELNPVFDQEQNVLFDVCRYRSSAYYRDLISRALVQNADDVHAQLEKEVKDNDQQWSTLLNIYAGKEMAGDVGDRSAREAITQIMDRLVSAQTIAYETHPRETMLQAMQIPAMAPEQLCGMVTKLHYRQRRRLFDGEPAFPEHIERFSATDILERPLEVAANLSDYPGDGALLFGHQQLEVYQDLRREFFDLMETDSKTNAMRDFFLSSVITGGIGSAVGRSFRIGAAVGTGAYLATYAYDRFEQGTFAWPNPFALLKVATHTGWFIVVGQSLSSRLISANPTLSPSLARALGYGGVAYGDSRLAGSTHEQALFHGVEMAGLSALPGLVASRPAYIRYLSIPSYGFVAGSAEHLWLAPEQTTEFVASDMLRSGARRSATYLGGMAGALGQGSLEPFTEIRGGRGRSGQTDFPWQHSNDLSHRAGEPRNPAPRVGGLGNGPLDPSTSGDFLPPTPWRPPPAQTGTATLSSPRSTQPPSSAHRLSASDAVATLEVEAMPPTVEPIPIHRTPRAQSEALDVFIPDNLKTVTDVEQFRIEEEKAKQRFQELGDEREAEHYPLAPPRPTIVVPDDDILPGILSPFRASADTPPPAGTTKDSAAGRSPSQEEEKEEEDSDQGDAATSIGEIQSNRQAAVKVLAAVLRRDYARYAQTMELVGADGKPQEPTDEQMIRLHAVANMRITDLHNEHPGRYPASIAELAPLIHFVNLGCYRSAFVVMNVGDATLRDANYILATPSEVRPIFERLLEESDFFEEIAGGEFRNELLTRMRDALTRDIIHHPQVTVLAKHLPYLKLQWSVVNGRQFVKWYFARKGDVVRFLPRLDQFIQNRLNTNRQLLNAASPEEQAAALRMLRVHHRFPVTSVEAFSTMDSSLIEVSVDEDGDLTIRVAIPQFFGFETPDAIVDHLDRLMAHVEPRGGATSPPAKQKKTKKKQGKKARKYRKSKEQDKRQEKSWGMSQYVLVGLSVDAMQGEVDKLLQERQRQQRQEVRRLEAEERQQAKQAKQRRTQATQNEAKQAELEQQARLRRRRMEEGRAQIAAREAERKQQKEQRRQMDLELQQPRQQREQRRLQRQEQREQQRRAQAAQRQQNIQATLAALEASRARLSEQQQHTVERAKVLLRIPQDQPFSEEQLQELKAVYLALHMRENQSLDGLAEHIGVLCREQLSDQDMGRLQLRGNALITERSAKRMQEQRRRREEEQAFRLGQQRLAEQERLAGREWNHQLQVRRQQQTAGERLAALNGKGLKEAQHFEGLERVLSGGAEESDQRLENFAVEADVEARFRLEILEWLAYYRIKAELKAKQGDISQADLLLIDDEAGASQHELRLRPAVVEVIEYDVDQAGDGSFRQNLSALLFSASERLNESYERAYPNPRGERRLHEATEGVVFLVVQPVAEATADEQRALRDRVQNLLTGIIENDNGNTDAISGVVVLLNNNGDQLPIMNLFYDRASDTWRNDHSFALSLTSRFRQPRRFGLPADLESD